MKLQSPARLGGRVITKHRRNLYTNFQETFFGVCFEARNKNREQILQAKISKGKKPGT